MKLLLLAGLFGAAFGCKVTDWGEWSECQYEENDHDVDSYPAPPKPLIQGRSEQMKQIMAKKEQTWAEWNQCVKDGHCKVQKSQVGNPEACTGGSAAGYDCSNIDFLSHLDMFNGLGYNPNHDRLPVSDESPSGTDIWGWTDPVNNDEYALIGLSGATSFVRVTDPANPFTVGILYSATVASGWRDLKVVGNWVYIVSEASGHGMQAFNLERLRGVNSFTEFDADNWYELVGNSHNIVANPARNRLYIVGDTDISFPGYCMGGLHIVDVTDPGNPQEGPCIPDDGYVHDAQCVNYQGPDTRFTGRDICFCYNEDSFTIIDVDAEDEDGIILAREDYVGRAYTHQGWLTEDQSIALMDDEQDEESDLFDQRTRTYIWDVSRLDDPILMTTHFSTETAIDHNQYVLGQYTYQANYQAGLRILRIDQANYELEEVAYFDIHRDETEARYNGAWSNYPYYTQGANGTVAVSSIENGLYMLRPNFSAIERELAQKQTKGRRSRNRKVLNTKGGQCPVLHQSETC